MKDIRILEEAMERAKDDEGKLALMDLIADNLTEFSVLVAVPGKEDLPIPGLPLFTREKFMEELPETTAPASVCEVWELLAHPVPRPSF